MDDQGKIMDAYRRELICLRDSGLYPPVDEKHFGFFYNVTGRCNDTLTFKSEDEARLGARMAIGLIVNFDFGGSRTINSGSFTDYFLSSFTRLYIKYHTYIDEKYLCDRYIGLYDQGVWFNFQSIIDEDVNILIKRERKREEVWELWYQNDPVIHRDGVGNFIVWLPREMVEDILQLI